MVVKKHATKWLVPFLKYIVGFGLLGYVIYKYWGPNEKTGAPGLGQLLEGPIAFHWLGLAVLLIAGAACLQLYRWYLLVRALDLPFSLRNAYRLGLVGIYYNTFFPGSVGGDLLKAYFIAHAHPERKAKAIATVVVDRAMGLFGLILFTAVTGSVAWALGDACIVGNPELQWLVKVMAGVAVGTAVGFLLLGLLPQRRVDRFAVRLKVVPKLGHSLAEVWFAVWMYRQRMRVVLVGLVISAGAHCGLVFSFHCASRVFPPNNPNELATLPEHLVLAPMGFIVQALPLSPGGVGVGEAAFAGLYKLADRPETRGVIARLSMRIAEWMIALMGYIVYLRMRAEVQEIQHEVEEDEEDEETEDGNPEMEAKSPGNKDSAPVG
jgi:uncharacterized membrane protein YbhN (UPF0104 family)